MKKTSYLLLPIAAFALSATGVAAFNPDLLEKAGLTEEQVAAFTVAHELRKEGDKEGARDTLIEAGVDLDTLDEVRKTMRAERKVHHEAIQSAISNGDYEAFKEVVEYGPLMDAITSESDFEKLVEAHALREAGDHEAAIELFNELGLERPHGHGGKHDRGMRMHEEE